MASNYTLVSKTSDSDDNINMELNDNDDFEEKKRLSPVSLCSDNFRIVNGKIPSTLVAIQTIALMLLVAAVALTVAILIIPFWKVAQINSEKSISIGLFSICTSTNQSTTIAFWNNDLTWKLEIRDEPSYIFFSRTFLLFSLVTGLFGTFLSIVGSGMVCCKIRCTCFVQFFASLFIVAAGVLSGLTGCLFPIMFKDPVDNSQQDQINFILSREKYFEIDARVRTTFRNGICLFACWGVMALYAIGSSLYIFSAFLVCSPNLKPKKMRYTSVQTTEEEKTITKIHSRINLVDQELQSHNDLELRQQNVQVKSQHHALLPGERREITTTCPPQQQRNKMPRAYSPVYPEYVEEIKPSLENTSSVANPASINRANFDTASIPSRSQTFPLQHERDLGNQIDQIMSADKYAFEQNYGSLYEYDRELPSKNASVKSVTLAPTKENRQMMSSASQMSSIAGEDGDEEEAEVPFMDDLKALERSKLRYSPNPVSAVDAPSSF